ncbi:zinc finger BED domain-containing protein 5-like [Onthophagus taurus]|uniref:zinc finger BED domain-containing protein 5-like n=1 Tax=Onthophagus taurus TaxID=166361 RepID=UPI0039BEBF8F
MYNQLQELEPSTSLQATKKLAFNANEGWPTGFIKRHASHNVKIKGEVASADENVAKTFPDKLAKIVEEGGYTPEQIFNADEPGLFWKKMPERTYIAKSEKSAGFFKEAKDRVTFLLCSNASGDKMLKPLLINKSLMPRALGVMRGLTEGGNQKILETSFNCEMHHTAETIGETLIKPAVKIMAEVMIGDKAKQTLDRIPLSNNTVHRRIIDMANNVKQMLFSDISQSRYYALQVDESSDTTNFANLMAFVRYEKNQEIHDDFLFCQPLLGHTTGEDIFNVMNKFMQDNKISWTKCVGISTDGAKISKVFWA